MPSGEKKPGLALRLSPLLFANSFEAVCLLAQTKRCLII